MKSPCCLSVRPLYRFEAVAQLQGNESVNTLPAATDIHQKTELLVKVNLSKCLIKNHAMKTYWGLEIWLHHS